MLPENDSDGYHLGFVHLALFKTVRNAQYQRVVGDERAIKAVVRDWGDGHIEIDWSPGYQRPFEWFGGASGSAVDEYVAAMERRYGAEATQQRIMQGSRPRPDLPEPLPRRDQHRDRGAAERRGVRALAHADVPRGRAAVQPPAAPHGRGGHGPGVVPDAGGPHGGRAQPGRAARAQRGVARAEPRASTASTSTPRAARARTSPTRRRTAGSGSTTGR